MDKEKEIEEVCGIIDRAVSVRNDCIFGVYDAAENVVNAGYRKADEVRKETIKECSKWLHNQATFLEGILVGEFDEAFGVEAE